MPSVLNDVRYAFRSLIRARGFTALAVVLAATGAWLGWNWADPVVVLGRVGSDRGRPDAGTYGRGTGVN